MFTRRQMMGAAAALSFLASTGAGVAQDLYIPLISKGFQHQFWQAVKTGADKAGQEMGVRVSFDGPDNETQVDKQIDMLAAALANKPAAIVSVSPGAVAAFGANHHLRQPLVFLNMPTMQQPEVYIGNVADLLDENGKLKKDDTKAFLKSFTDAFAAWIDKTKV